MECGKLTAKLRDAVPVCFLVEDKEVKRYKNIEIPDELKKLPYKNFRLDVPMSGAITFKIMFEQGILPEVWPEARERRTRGANRPQEEAPIETAQSVEVPTESEETAAQETPAVEESAEVEESLDAALDAIIAGVEPQEPKSMTINFNVTGDRRKALVETIGNILYCKPIYKNAPTFAYAIDGYLVSKNGTLTGEYNAELLAALEEEGFTTAE